MSKETVKLGLMPPLTGVVSLYGEEISRAAQIACQEVNESGGVLGLPLQLVVEDDGSLPESAVTAAEKLLDQHHCAAIIGNLLSNARIAVAYSVAEPRKIPYLNFSFYEGSILSRYFFHFAALPNQQIDRMIPYMRQQFGSRMFFAGNNYEWPRGSIHAAKLVLERAGGVVVGEEYCPIGVDAEAIECLLDNVEAAAPDVFVPYFAGIDQVQLLTRFSQRGMKQHIAVVMGHYDEIMASALPNEVREGFYSCNTYFMSMDTAENQDYKQRLARLPGVTGIWPDGNGILTNFGEGAYVCVKAFAKAANLAGSLDSEALVKALETINIKAPQGLVQMNPTHHHARVNTCLSRCEANGEFKIIEKFGAIDPLLPKHYSHQKISQRASLEEDVRLQARMLEQLSDGVILISIKENLIIYANPGADRLFGFGEGEIVGLPVAKLNGPFDRNQPNSVVEVLEVLQKKGEWQGEIRYAKQDGTPVWCSSTISTFTHPSYGEVWLSVNHNISELKQAEIQLRTITDQLKEAQGIAHVGSWSMDIVNNKLEWSEEVFRIFEINPKHFSANYEYFLNSIHPDDRDAVNMAFNTSLETRLPYEITHRLLMRDGRIKWVHEKCRSTFDDAGKPLYSHGIVQDITEQKQVDEALQKSQEQFYQSQKMETIGTLVGGIAHDFNNMLAGITGNLYLARKRTQQMPDVVEKLDAVERISFRAADMIKQLLTFARKGEVDIKEIPFVQFIKETLKLLRASVPENITIKQNISDDSMQIKGDPTQLHQVLMNLINNARDALEGVDDPHIIISLAKFHADDAFIESHPNFKAASYVHLSVEDNGSGIPQHQMKHIFEPFFTTKEVGKGTGLGLAMVIGAIKTHHGFIEVESREGEGSTFHIYLPLQKSNAIDSASAYTEVIEGHGEVILIVDDNAEVRSSSAAILESMNYKVIEASDGLEAVAVFGSNQDDIALIIMDLVMPRLGGMEAFKRIREVQPNVDVIFSTGYDKEIALKGEGYLSEYTVLSKPYNIEKLSKTISDKLAKNSRL